ncbi:hypothetical protein MRB53_021718 [Persea americana]|uniref:Uncharacterized protein n=1 Tax=Persea americana TaxID=3435 RepID=A0ACC2L4U2_PERAE|nr:hypothetical protein MRB53_021718 [Persea americana]
MQIKEENQKIDENSIVYMDAKGKVLVYRVEKNERLVNVVMGQKSDILIGLPNGPRNNAASGGEEDEDRNGRVEKSESNVHEEREIHEGENPKYQSTAKQCTVDNKIPTSDMVWMKEYEEEGGGED